jgi:hypothetical protein
MGKRASQLDSRLKTVLLRHAEIGQDQVRPKALDLLHETRAIVSRPNDLELAFEFQVLANRIQSGARIIGNQDANPAIA